MVQAEAGSASQGRQSSLKNLSAFLTLSKAQDRGFDAAKFGLSSDEAADIATVFSRSAFHFVRAWVSCVVARLQGGKASCHQYLRCWPGGR